jgi:DNA-binding NarL/FixJ family response regulator
MKSCLVCDDHPMMREALAGTIAMHWPEAEIALAGDFPSAWAAAAAQPDFILCDLGMPGAAPLEGVAGIAAAAPGARLVVITADVSNDLLRALFGAGIAGLIPKASSGAIMEAAIRLVLAGGSYIPPRVIAMMSSAPAIADDQLRLSERQITVLARVAAGASNKEIARDLQVSPATIKAQVAALLAVLGATNRMEATARGRALGYIG